MSILTAERLADEIGKAHDDYMRHRALLNTVLSWDAKQRRDTLLVENFETIFTALRSHDAQAARIDSDPEKTIDEGTAAEADRTEAETFPPDRKKR